MSCRTDRKNILAAFALSSKLLTRFWQRTSSRMRSWMSLSNRPFQYIQIRLWIGSKNDFIGAAIGWVPVVSKATRERDNSTTPRVAQRNVAVRNVIETRWMQSLSHNVILRLGARFGYSFGQAQGPLACPEAARKMIADNSATVRLATAALKCKAVSETVRLIPPFGINAT
jgi:hypothetical protein